ncbi:hypothetical protein TRFO_38449 [Tritrichomonas foetus]|uniref:Protein kinase domain-containing protein n=1 Tax=Tritrichomonas foetus TaxID=1144522 RepID=A0A1J4J8E9_9EUKA|nr:hypothetical protein TRFO_38449 [Tritrichomonas foetus]|eukprot:OHS95466.1 hypothetical protein TRFO_38449 [Tritrichomonas foetus]
MYLVQHKTNQSYFSMRLSQFKVNDSYQINKFTEEVELMSACRHASISPLKGFFLPNEQDETAAILTDYMNVGTVKNYIDQCAQYNLSIQGQNNNIQANSIYQNNSIYNTFHKMKIILGIAVGMMYLHSKNIIFADLRPENIFLNDQAESKIFNFSNAKTLSHSDDCINDPMEFSQYTAPEVLSGQCYDLKIDVYAFALISFEILIGKIAFSQNPTEYFNKICNGERPAFPPTFPLMLKTLFERCWDSNPLNRPKFNEIVYVLSNREAFIQVCSIPTGAYATNDNQSSEKEFEEYSLYLTQLLTDKEESNKLSLFSLQSKLIQQNQDISKVNSQFSNFRREIAKTRENLLNELALLRNEKIETQKMFTDTIKKQSEMINQLLEQNHKLSEELKLFKAESNPQSHKRNSSFDDTVVEDSPLVNFYSRSDSKSSFTLSNDDEEYKYASLPGISPQFNFVPSNMRQRTSGLANPQIQPRRSSEFNMKSLPPEGMVFQKQTSQPFIQLGIAENERKNDIFRGILDKLNNDYQHNLINSKIVFITGTSFSESDQNNLRNIVNYNWNSFWRSAPMNSPYIQIMLNYQAITITAYSLRVCGCDDQNVMLKSWVLEGSNNPNNPHCWVEIDTRINCPQLCEKHEALFKTKNTTGVFRCIRLRQTNFLNSNPVGFALTNIEFYGQVKKL